MINVLIENGDYYIMSHGHPLEIHSLISPMAASVSLQRLCLFQGKNA